ncbi:MAG TPA: DUF3445 domain-containing protein [Ilumatobacteraceae bacterium]
MSGWLDELKLEPGPPFSAMGTHALKLDEWLVVDEHRAPDLHRKAALLATERPMVFAAEAGSEAAGAEALELIEAWLADHSVAGQAASARANTVEPNEHPLLSAARLVQEDLVVMQRIAGAWVLTAGAVCFPTHWTVSDKVGLPLEGIHAPVAHYETELREKVDRFHDRLQPRSPVWRRNWFIVPTAELYLPAYGSRLGPPPTIAADGSPMWIRSERQTLRRLPQTDAILFTIRVQLAPLVVLRDRPDIAAKLLAVVRSWDRAKRMYTSTGGAIDAIVAWLDRVVSADSQ